LALFPCLAASQEREPPTLRLSGVLPGGARTSATESWGTFDFTLDNLTDSDRQARLLTLYAGRPEAQYGRDVWVPARSSLSTWMLVGPAVTDHPGFAAEIEYLLSDRTGGQDRPIRSGEERVQSRKVLHRKREPYTVILLDEEPLRGPVPGELPRPETPAEEAVILARTVRSARNLSDLVQQVRPGPLPATPLALDGVDHFVLASGRIADDPAGLRALRLWVEQGGKLWVMLDRVDPDAVAPLLGEALDFQLVDRVGLTAIDINLQAAGQAAPEPLAKEEHERPVTFARVLLPDHERPRHTVNGWPAWFTRPLGRGKIVFTALGPRGWYRPRKTPGDPPSPYPNFPRTPVPLQPLLVVADELQPAPEADPYSAEALRPLVTPEIGYSVVGRGTVVLVFGAFLLGALALGLALRRSRRPELLGWLAPAAALGAAATFVVLGEASRRAVPPTVAVAQVVEAVPGLPEAPVHGELAVYRPDSGPAEAGAAEGGLFELDMKGAEGKARRLILTDTDAWHWEGLALPAGVRTGSFRWTAPTGEPIAAVAHFGPDGVEGKLTAGPFRDLADALLNPPNGRNLALRLGPDGTFSAATEDALPAGQFLAGSVLSDRQQRRQAFYRQALKRPEAGRLEGDNVLMAWADPIDMGFALVPRDGAPAVGNALLIVPLRLERTTPGQRVTIPGPLVPYRRVQGAGTSRPKMESNEAADMHLRFQLPEAVLPFHVERARLLAKVSAPGRRLRIVALAGGELYSADSPLDPIRIPIGGESLLRPDEQGGLHLEVSLGEPTQGGDAAKGKSLQSGEKWVIEYLELEVVGRAE
jgi:hypothetical protein